MRTASSWLERRFVLAQRGSSAGRELLAGLTTFLTLSYILFAQPAILGNTGMPRDDVFLATCVASAVGCALMGWLANYPVALAPAMGHNVFFAFTVCGVLGYTWQQALAANLVAGLFFALTARLRLREYVMATVPGPLRYAIAAGIGMLIAFLGLQWAHFVRDDPVVLVNRASLANPVALAALAGLAVAATGLSLRLPGAFLAGIAASSIVLYAYGLLPTDALRHPVSLPQPSGQTLFAFDFGWLFSGFGDLTRGLAIVFVFLVLDLFDTVGTLLGLSHAAGLLKGDRLPRAQEALFSDAAATVVGCCLGTSTVTSYIESSAGIAAGGRTGLTALCVALLFLASLPLAPLASIIGAPISFEGRSYYPTIAPILILVGVLMATGLREVRWSDPTEAIPTFLTVLIMMSSFSITDGIAWGYGSYVVLKTLRGERLPAVLYAIAALFVLHFVVMELLAA